MARSPIKISSKLQDAALILLKRNLKLKRGEKVLLITDRTNCPIFVSISAAVNDLGGKLTEAYITPDREHSSPIPPLMKVAAESDVIIAPTDKSVTHSPETRNARKKFGARLVSMPGITEDMFIKGVSVDPEDIKKINFRLRRHILGAKEFHIASPSGTDFNVSLRSKKCKGFEFNDHGDASKKGSVTNLPYGEVYSFFELGNGTLVIDRWKNKITQKKKAVLEIIDGKILKWNKAADQYVKHQLNAGECGLCIVEFGIGTNISHKKPVGIVLYDEKVYGSVHFAFGGGGEIRQCGIHEDFLVLNPTVTAEGKTIIKGGKFVFD